MNATIIRNYPQLTATLRARADDLDMTREAIDMGAPLQSGYAGKLLAPTPIKGVGRTSLGPLLGVLKMVLVAVPEDDVPKLMDAYRHSLETTS